MKTIKFEVEIDIECPVELTEDNLIGIAGNIDLSIRRGEDDFGLMPTMVYEDVKLIRVKPKLEPKFTFEDYKYHTLCAMGTIYPGKSMAEVINIIELQRKEWK